MSTATEFPFTNSDSAMHVCDIIMDEMGWDIRETPVELELTRTLEALTLRLSNRDPTLTHLELWLGSYADLLLDYESVQMAFDSCMESASRNDVVKYVTLKGLPERELKLAMQSLPSNTQSLFVEETSRSQSLPYSAFDHIPTSIRTLRLDARISLKSSNHVARLASALSNLSSLEEVQLHVLPRCSFEDPWIDLGSLLESLSGLRILQLTAGYDFNYYHKPIFSTSSLQLFLHNNPQLQQLQLDNMGLQDGHWTTIMAHAPLSLQDLHTTKHRTVSPSTLQRLCSMEQLESCVVLSNDECARRSSPNDAAVLGQEELHMWCLLRRCRKRGGQELLRAMESSSSNRYITGALYTILRSNPTLVQSDVHQQLSDDGSVSFMIRP